MTSDRRTFLKASAAGAALFPASALGANDRIQVGLIGSGTRGTAIGGYARKYANGKVVAVCDVDKNRREAFAKADPECELYGDYRRVLDRKDIDAVMVATPDHWHMPIFVAALQAGKHVYVEKPLSNTVDGAVKMLNAAERYKKVVQVGTMQRSAQHFQAAVKLVQSGGIGPITQVVVTHPAGGAADRKMDTTPQPVPEGLDWEMWQGDAPKHPYTPTRARNWRSWYEYGGGSLTDWGIHHVDIVHMALDPDGTNPPLYVSGAGNYEFLSEPDRLAVPATWSVTVQYANFMMTVLSCTPPLTGNLVQGPMFWGSKGMSMVNRAGYMVQPTSYFSPYMTRLGMTNRPGAAFVPLGGESRGAQAGAPGGAPGRGQGAPGGGAPGRAQGAPGGGMMGMGGRGPQEPPIPPQEVLIDQFSRVQAGWESDHVWNWLDCIKSGQKPIADIVTSFNGHLACLMGVESIRQNRALRWDPKSRTARPA